MLIQFLIGVMKVAISVILLVALLWVLFPDSDPLGTMWGPKEETRGIHFMGLEEAVVPQPPMYGVPVEELDPFEEALLLPWGDLAEKTLEVIHAGDTLVEGYLRYISSTWEDCSLWE